MKNMHGKGRAGAPTEAYRHIKKLSSPREKPLGASHPVASGNAPSNAGATGKMPGKVSGRKQA